MDFPIFFVDAGRVSEFAKFEHDVFLGWAVPLGKSTNNGEAIVDNVGTHKGRVAELASVSSSGLTE